LAHQDGQVVGVDLNRSESNRRGGRFRGPN
jgi:hypothetical protein